jgi:hypothetical protein
VNQTSRGYMLPVMHWVPICIKKESFLASKLCAYTESDGFAGPNFPIQSFTKKISGHYSIDGDCPPKPRWLSVADKPAKEAIPSPEPNRF